MIDFKTVKLDFCDQNDIQVNRKVCVKECKRDCTEEYFNPFKTQSFGTEKKKNIIRFEARNLPIFQYKFEPQYSFVQFISNIGGILSLWYGISVSDIYVIIKKILIYIQIYLTQYLFNYLDSLIETLTKIRILKFIVKVIIIFKKFIDRLDKYNIKLFVRFLCIPYFVYQVIEITQIYLYFSTNVNVELKPIINDELISVQRLPALTVCYESDLNNVFDGDKQFFDQIISKSKQNISENQKFWWSEDSESMLKINSSVDPFLRSKLSFLHFRETFPNEYKKMFEFIINYMKFGKRDKSPEKYSTNSDEMNFFSNYFNCFVKINQTFNCSEISERVLSFSFLGKCNTYLFDLRNKFGLSHEFRSLNNENIISSAQPITFMVFKNYFSNKFYIHSSESMASLSYYDRINSDPIFSINAEFSEYNFKKLEYPYDTDCRKYGNKSRTECLNECYIREQIKSQNCIKNEEFLIMFKINANGLEPDIQFCLNEHNLKNNSFLANQMIFCSNECPVSCKEQLFIVESSNQKFDSKETKIRKLNLNIYKNNYIDINYSPNMLFMQYIIGVANLISLWHGLDFTTIMNQIFSYILKLLMKTEIEIIINRIVEILMDYSLLRNFIAILSRTFKSMVKNLQVLQLFFNLKKTFEINYFSYYFISIAVLIFFFFFFFFLNILSHCICVSEIHKNYFRLV